MALKCRGHQELSMLFRNNLKLEGNKGAIELTWTRPIIKSTDLMLQYFNGYGESLLDYDHPVNRFSIGVAFSNWLG
jgi:phospholipase A1